MNPIFFLIFLKFSMGERTNCLPRDYGQGSVVCVCNSKHCDSLPPVQKLDPSSYMVYTSNKDGQRLVTSSYTFITEDTESNKEYPDETECVDKNYKEYSNCSRTLKQESKEYSTNLLKGEEDEAVQIIIINQSKKYQSIVGWGGAFTDSTGINVNSLSQELQNQLLSSYFSGDGLAYNLGRVPIGGSDFSTRGYTYLDTQDDGDYCEDPLLTKFKLAKEDHIYKIPLINEAAKLSPDLLLLGSVWTSPKWMKENGEYKGMLGYLKKKMYKPWANYFVKFLDEYKNQNITFWALTTGNEAVFNLGQLKLPGVLWDPEDQSIWIENYFGPAIRNSAHFDVKLLLADDLRSILPHYVNTILSVKKNNEYLDGIAVHWYYDSEDNAYILDDLHEKYPDKLILYTEACLGFLDNKVLLGSWDRGEELARNIIDDLNHWAMSWIDWNMALDLKGGPNYINNFVDAPIIVNATAHEFYKQPMYYIFGHFSKFIPRDSVRIYSTQCDTSEIQIVAFKRPDNGVVVVILNKTDKLKRRNLFDPTRGEMQLELSPRSITTIIYY